MNFIQKIMEYGYYQKTFFGEKNKIQLLKNPFEVKKQILGNKDDIVVVDIGAYTGDMIIEYKKYFPRAKIYGFEPFDTSFKKLKETTKMMTNVYLIQKAVSDIVGSTSLIVNCDNSCNSMNKMVESKRRDLSKRVKITTTTLDEFVKENKIEKIDILKIDVEGAERRVFAGAHKILKKGDIGIVYIEMMFVPKYEGSAKYFEICQTMDGFGYDLFDLFDVKHDKEGKLRWCNALFVKSS